LAIFAIVEKNHVNNELRPGGVLCRFEHSDSVCVV